MADRLELIINNALYIRHRSSHLPSISAGRGLSLVSAMCQADYIDYVSRHTKLKNDDVLGKRKEKHVFNLVKEMDGKRLKVADGDAGRPASELEGEYRGWSEEKKRLLLECIGDDLEKMRRILKIHQAKTLLIRQGVDLGEELPTVANELEGKEHANIYQHEKNLIEVALYSKLAMEDKFTFLWDLLSIEFDKEDHESRYNDFLEFILDLLIKWEDLNGKSMKPWEIFMKKLPKVDKRILEHVYDITKEDRNSILLYEMVQYASKEMKIIGVSYMLRSGMNYDNIRP